MLLNQNGQFDRVAKPGVETSSGICNITSLTSKQKDSIHGLVSNFEI
jgi:hypothetical protein